MKTHEPLSSAKSVAALLILLIAIVIFWKFWTNQDSFFGDLEALRSYVVVAIVGGGLLIGLLYLTSQTTHKQKTVKAKSKSTKRKKK